MCTLKSRSRHRMQNKILFLSLTPKSLLSTYERIHINKMPLNGIISQVNTQPADASHHNPLPRPVRAINALINLFARPTKNR